jgi:tetratricopeptide (TPR) repeat protein
MRVGAGIALSRVYRESGDLGRAIDTGERVLADLAESGLDSCDEAIQLTVTIAAAYFERGDSGHAVRICRAAIAQAEALGSPRARASAYWNASAMQARRGDILSAAPLAERALALLSEGQDARNLARLRGELGLLQLALDPPDVEQARLNLEKAAEDLAWSSASPADRAWTQLGLARARFLAGDLTGSRELTTEVHEMSDGVAPLAEAEARALEGQTHAAEGDMAQAARAYQEAVHLLSAIGADRGAAQLWFDLAGLLEQVGQAEAARDAYKRAAASTGLRARTTTPTRTLV